MTKKRLTRDEILAASDITTVVVPVPEWGGDVIVKTITGEERETYELDTTRGRMSGKLMARLVALCAVDEKGDRLFTDQDVIALGQKSGRALGRVWLAAARLNGIGGRQLEELEKNSGAGTSDASGSDSP